MKIFTRLIDGNRNMDIGYYYYLVKRAVRYRELPATGFMVLALFVVA